mmetsp:Transcript_6593/g.14338  ORF Transcript_6593/g.14338 Transcript_6593/m.14338 type:complete len:360 (-) Transcript_6593:97-1176(-)
MEWIRKKWADLQEWNLPADSFAHSKTPQQDLRDARCVLNVFYTFMALLFLGFLARLIFWTRAEVFSTTIKVDYVEAPSLAICPFEFNATILPPNTDNKTWVTIKKQGVKGAMEVEPKISACVYDRKCICVDMSKQVLSDITVEATASDRIDDGGAGELQSDVRNGFSEAIEVKTRLGDTSTRNALKLGFYDSVDHIPMWFYANEGSYNAVHLELRLWYAVSLTFRSILSALYHGASSPLVWKRHLFRMSAEDVDAIDFYDGTPRRDTTTISYGMRNFFVDETLSSENAWSIYNLAALVLLLLMQSTLANYFFNAMFPADDEASRKVQPRRLSRASKELVSICCCSRRRDGEANEQSPLV